MIEPAEVMVVVPVWFTSASEMMIFPVPVDVMVMAP